MKRKIEDMDIRNVGKKDTNGTDKERVRYVITEA